MTEEELKRQIHHLKWWVVFPLILILIYLIWQGNVGTRSYNCQEYRDEDGFLYETCSKTRVIDEDFDGSRGSGIFEY